MKFGPLLPKLSYKIKVAYFFETRCMSLFHTLLTAIVSSRVERYQPSINMYVCM